MSIEAQLTGRIAQLAKIQADLEAGMATLLRQSDAKIAALLGQTTHDEGIVPKNKGGRPPRSVTTVPNSSTFSSTPRASNGVEPSSPASQ